MSLESHIGSRITRNAIMLYLRMAIAIIIGLYTSRIVLEQLGITDFGIYGVVGSIIALTEFINSALSNSFSRFFAYHIEQDNNCKHQVYGSAIIISLIAAFFIVILGETLGFWYFSNYLDIPSNRIEIAKFTYHCCVIGASLRVMQLPFSSCLIANEKMVAFAYIEILNSALRLGVAIFLMLSTFDKLYSYSILILAITATIAVCYIYYCKTKVNECKRFAYSKDILLQMSKFSILDLYGTICYSTRTHGTALLLNSFFGVALNAANSIALSIQHILNGISSNIIMAFSPQIIKKHSADATEQMLELISKATRYTFFLYFIVAIPLLVETEQILHIWLGNNIPQYTTTFCQLIIILTGLAIPINILNTCIHATGKIKFLSIGIGSMYLITLPIIYIGFSYGLNPNYAYIIYIAIMCAIILMTLLNVKHLIQEFKLSSYFRNAILPVILVLALSISIPLISLQFTSCSIITVSVSALSTLFAIFFLGLDSCERNTIINKIRR